MSVVPAMSVSQGPGGVREKLLLVDALKVSVYHRKYKH